MRTAGRTAKGLFNKVRNQATRRRFVVSTIKKDEALFETAVFEVNFFYLPRRWSNPDLAVETRAKDEAGTCITNWPPAWPRNTPPDSSKNTAPSVLSQIFLCSCRL